MSSIMKDRALGTGEPHADPTAVHASDAPPLQEAKDVGRPTPCIASPPVGIAAHQRIARVALLGAEVGALGAVADDLRVTFLTGARWQVIAELAIGCTVVGVVTCCLFAVAIGAVWELTEGAGRQLQRAWPSLPSILARNLPIATLLLVSFARDADGLVSGNGISRTALEVVVRRVFPGVACLLVVVFVRFALMIHARLRSTAPAGRVGVLLGCLALAALLVHAERLPQLSEYAALRRYCAFGAFLSSFFGLALFGKLASASEAVSQGTRVLRLGYAVVPLVLCLSLPFLFSSNTARVALASRSFVASPEVHALSRLVDFDRDGYSPLVGGGDCNDFDRRVHPFSHDIPGDGIDTDCDGFDGWQVDPPDVTPPYGPPDAPAVADLRARAGSKNVLVILVDALRFDRLQGAQAGAFPRLAGLFRQSISFTHALSPASRTLLAVPPILDGNRVSGPGTRLFHELHAAGSHAGYVGLDLVIEYMHLARRFDGEVDLVGISTVGDRSLWGGGVQVFTGRSVTDSALHWVDAQGSPQKTDRAPPWLLWVHYYSAHQWDFIKSLRSVPGMSQRYDAALADDDRSAGELLDGLAARGLLESTVVVLLADHGESLGDHGWRTHGLFLYPELVHVPLSILIPGVPPRSIATPVPAAALTPTLLDLLGVGQTGADSLPSLVPLMAGVAPTGDGARRPILMHDNVQDAIALDRRILRITRSENVTELFSLDDYLDVPDPENLVAREPATVRRLSQLLVSDLSP
jgi:hypothetical protein